MDYRTIEALPPSAYLTPTTFRTSFDTLPVNVARQTARYEDGLKVSREAREVSISARGTWSATLLTGGHLTSYEGIGYHANTEAFLRGLLAGPAPIVVYRLTPEGEVTRTEVKGRTEN